MPLLESQGAFAAAILDPEQPPPPGVAGGRRFDVYRNNVTVSLSAALAKQFPVVEQLVGQDFFRAMAVEFIRHSPPRSPLLFLYGETFPAFLDGFPPVSSLPYLSDVAHFELAWSQSYHALDVEPLPVEEVAAIPLEVLSGAVLKLHPSLRLMSSPHPVVSIWQAHQGAEEPDLSFDWTPEDALILRPALEVEVRRLPPGGLLFLSMLQAELPLGEAAARAAAQEPEFDLNANLVGLLSSGAVASIQTEQEGKTK